MMPTKRAITHHSTDKRELTFVADVLLASSSVVTGDARTEFNNWRQKRTAQFITAPPQVGGRAESKPDKKRAILYGYRLCVQPLDLFRSLLRFGIQAGCHVKRVLGTIYEPILKRWT